MPAFGFANQTTNQSTRCKKERYKIYIYVYIEIEGKREKEIERERKRGREGERDRERKRDDRWEMNLVRIISMLAIDYK